MSGENWHAKAELDETPADDDDFLLRDISDTTTDASANGSIIRVSYLNVIGAVLKNLRSAFTPASASGPASLALAEDIDNGSNTVTLVAPATIASDAVVTIPATTGTAYVSNGTDVAVADGGTGASDAPTARTNLGVDAAGTDNSTNVSLAGSPDYLTIVGQVITRALINLTSHVTGTLPVANGGTGAATHGSGNFLVGAGTGAVTSAKAAPSGTVVGTSDTQTLTGKTITFADNTLTNVMSLTTAQSVTAGIKKTFQSDATNAGARFAGVTADPSSLTAGDIWYRSDTEKISYRGASAARLLVAEALAQTLTNKTIAFASNTLTNVMSLTTAQSITAGIKKTFQADATNAGIRLAGVTANPSTLVAGDVWYRTDTEKLSYRGASAARSLVAETLAQTLTNKTLGSTAESYADAGNKSGAASFDYTSGQWQKCVATGNITSMAVTNPPATGSGGWLMLEIHQDGTGGRTIAWGSAFRFPGGADYVLSTAASAIDIFTLCTRDGGTTWYVFEGGRAFAA